MRGLSVRAESTAFPGRDLWRVRGAPARGAAMTIPPTGYTTTEVAALLGVSRVTVGQWIRRGEMAATATLGKTSRYGDHGRWEWRVTDLTRHSGADRLPGQYLQVAGAETVADERLGLVLPEWQAADAWASGAPEVFADETR